MPPLHEVVIQKHYSILVDKVSLKNNLLWDKLIGKKIFTLADVNYIKERNPAERDQNREIFNELMKKDASAFQAYCDALRETGQDHIVKEYLKDTNDETRHPEGETDLPVQKPSFRDETPSNIQCAPQGAEELPGFTWVEEHDKSKDDFLSNSRKKLIQENRLHLMQKIELTHSDLMDELLERKVINKRQETKILEADNDERKNDRLLEMLLKKTNRKYEEFCEALVCSDQIDIVRTMLTTEDDLRAAQQHFARYFLYDFCHINMMTLHGGRHAVSLEKLYQPMVWRQLVKRMTQYREVPLKSHGEIIKKMEHNLLTRIVVEGQPGAGKTTFAKRLAWEWAQQFLTNSQKETENAIIRKYSLVIPVILRHLKKGFNLYDALINQYPFLSVTEACSIGNLINKSPEKVLLIMDGYDELESGKVPIFQDIIEKNKYTYELVKCLTTSRPVAVEKLMKKPQAVDMYIQLVGFSPKDIKNYIEMFFEGDCEKANQMFDYIQEKPTLSKLAEIPVILEPMCILWDIVGRLGDTRWEIYEEFVRYLFVHMKTKPEDEGHPQSQPIYKNETTDQILYDLGKLANTWNEDGTLSLVFSDEDLRKRFNYSFDKILSIGCLYMSHPMTIRDKSSWGFLHKTFQEYFIATLIDAQDEELQDFMKKCSSEQGFREGFPVLDFLNEKDLTKTHCVISQALAKFEGTEENLSRVISLAVRGVNQWESTEATYVALPIKHRKLIMMIEFSPSMYPPKPAEKEQRFEMNEAHGKYILAVSNASSIKYLSLEREVNVEQPLFATPFSSISGCDPVLLKLRDDIVSSPLNQGKKVVLFITKAGVLGNVQQADDYILAME